MQQGCINRMGWEADLACGAERGAAARRRLVPPALPTTARPTTPAAPCPNRACDSPGGAPGQLSLPQPPKSATRSCLSLRACAASSGSVKTCKRSEAADS